MNALKVKPSQAQRLPIPLDSEFRKFADVNPAGFLRLNLRRNEEIAKHYPSFPKERLYLSWKTPKTIYEIEAHMAIIHLEPSALFEWGVPVYDLKLLQMLNQGAVISRFRELCLKMRSAESLDEVFSLTYAAKLDRLISAVDALIKNPQNWLLSHEFTMVERVDLEQFDIARSRCPPAIRT